MEKSKKADLSPEKADRFVRLLTTNHDSIYIYVITLVPHRPDADDIMQEVTSVMFQQFDSFKEGTNFTAWGKKIAFYEILQFRRQQKRVPLLFQDEKTLQMIDACVSRKGDQVDRLAEALRDCIKQLDGTAKRLVHERYHEGGTAETIAQKLGVHVSTIYRMLERIHYSLRQCVRKMRAGV